MKDIDWSKVAVDTKVLVSNDIEKQGWIRRKFAKFEDGKVFVFVDGNDSWTADNIGEQWRCESWTFTKLAEEPVPEEVLDYKSTYEKFNEEYCHSHISIDRDKCFGYCDECAMRWIFENHNVTRK